MKMSGIKVHTNNAVFSPTQIRWGTKVSSEFGLDCVHNSEMMNEDGGGATKHSTLPAYGNNNYRNKHNQCPVSMVSGNGELKPCLTLIVCDKH